METTDWQVLAHDTVNAVFQERLNKQIELTLTKQDLTGEAMDLLALNIARCVAMRIWLNQAVAKAELSPVDKIEQAP